MMYVLGFPRFDAGLTESLDRFRLEHEPQRARLVRPHVTLVFALSGVDPAAFSDFCRDALDGVRAIDVEFERSVLDDDPFEKTHKLLLECGRGRDAIVSLHRRLYDGPHGRQFDTTKPYSPHMTVATNDDRAALDGVDPSVIGAFPIRGVLDTVELVSLENGALRTLKLFTLAS